MMPGRIRIPCYALRPGDVLVPTGREVVSASSGLHTPSGKIDVWLKGVDNQCDGAYNETKHFTHNRRTIVTVERN